MFAEHLSTRIPQRVFQPQPDFVLTQSAIRAAALLGLSGTAFGRVIGLSETAVLGLQQGDRVLIPNSKAGELAALLIRLYVSLDVLVGDDQDKCVAWLNSQNVPLGGVPKVLIQTAEGLVVTLSYLDGMRVSA